VELLPLQPVGVGCPACGADIVGKLTRTNTMFYVEQILAQAGLSASEVDFTMLALPQMAAALQSHAIASRTCTAEPQVVTCSRKAGARTNLT
jgi:ABC-type nitrate/sulfonate/bicarbonate transport system substrate-binding protein